ncbi:MAG: tetratricopeptide repeat protein [Acidobacteriota bacterium]
MLFLLRCCVLLLVLPTASSFAVGSAAGESLDAERAMVEAEQALRAGETQVAESRYRTALLEGWLLLGALELAEGDLDEAAAAYRRAGTVAVETRRPTLALALVELRQGQADAAVDRLHQLRLRIADDLSIRRLFARALTAAGRTDEAIEELGEAHAAFPDDLELAFSLATGLLRRDDVEGAAALFDELIAARPIAPTHVLVGRTWRDFGHFERARSELEKAIELDGSARRAHYYLGTVLLRYDGRISLDQAIDLFERELELAPSSMVANLHLGIALVEKRRFGEALEHLQAAGGMERPLADAFLFEGRALLGLDRPDEALVAFMRALELAADNPNAPPDQLTSLHYQLARTLRLLGREDEAAGHFDLARDASADLATSSRERLGRYLEEAEEPVEGKLEAAGLRSTALDMLDSTARDGLRRRVGEVLGRSYLNLGVMQSQAGRPDRAADLLAVGAEIAPDFPRLQYSYGVASFQAGRHGDAVDPLQRALDRLAPDAPDAATVRRMLALSRLETGDPSGAVDLLADETLRADDPSLHYAYALALVRAGRPDAAEPIFARLLTEHDDWPELHVLLGQVHAQRSEYPAAIESFGKALAIDPTVVGAHGALGEIHLRSGDLPAAEASLRAELEHHSDDLRSRYNLATVLELDRRPEEAADLLRVILASAPEHGDARYLLGKILLSRGDAASAAVQLEAAAKLSPEAPEVRNQLGLAYQRLGDRERASAEFVAFRELKAKQREDG